MLIENIKPYEKNAKKHPKKQIEAVAKSIKEFGFNQPIVLDKDSYSVNVKSIDEQHKKPKNYNNCIRGTK